MARPIGISIFDPLGDEVGKVHDAIVLLQMRREPKAVGFVAEVFSRRRVFLPPPRITVIEPGAVIVTDLVNIRRFIQRRVEALVIGELLDRVVTMCDDLGNVTVRDVAIERDRDMDWRITRLLIQRVSLGPLGLRRGETLMVRPDEVNGLAASADQQGVTALLITLEDLKPANLADAMRDLPQDSQMCAAAELTDEHLADVLEKLGNGDVVALLPRLEVGRVTHVLGTMQPDDAADLVADLLQFEAVELLDPMEPEGTEDMRCLMAYDEYTAGGLMTIEPVILPPESTMATFLVQSRKVEVPPALAVVGFVYRPPLKSPTGELVGMIHLQRALREHPQRTVGSVADTDVDSVRSEDSVGTVTRLLATYSLTALPALNGAGRLLGIVSVDGVLDHLTPDDWRMADEAVTDETIERGANA